MILDHIFSFSALIPHASKKTLDWLKSKHVEVKLEQTEMKQGYLAKKQGSVAVKNLQLLIGGGNESKMSTYKLSSAKAIVSLGRHDAVAQLPLTTVIGLIPGLIKSKDLFVGKTRKELDLGSRIMH
ncbi:hypothetical protein L6452_08937 [Arctium lappa]|uniref:Uncharacterized protein n=1 Tax=Arctium lappa TaxID=4217 RepID=A0ACB9DJ59_ARCLA|nr:hypothetical protein L6452_08937 [Arctium lappa]